MNFDFNKQGLRLNDPTVDRAYFRGEVGTYFYDFPTISFEWKHIVFRVNLFECFLCRFVDFEFEDIYVVSSTDKHVDSSGCSLIFNIGVETHKFHCYVDHILIVPFKIFEIERVISEVGEETLQSLHEVFCATVTHIKNKLTDSKLCFILG